MKDQESLNSYIMKDFPKFTPLLLGQIINALKNRHIIRSQSHFADLMGIKPQYIVDIKQGKTAIKEEFITQIITSFPQIERNFLITGEGNPLRETEQSHANNKKEPLDGLVSNVKPLITQNEERLRIPVVRLDAPVSFSVGVTGYTWDDLPDFMEVEKIEDYRYSDLTLIFQVSGDEMYPVYRNRARVLCNYVKQEQRELATGVHVIATSTGTLLLKRIAGRENNTLILKNDNEIYADIYLPLDNITDIWKVEYITFSPAE